MYSDVPTEVSDMEHVHCIVQWLYSHAVYMCITTEWCKVVISTVHTMLIAT